MKLRILVVVLAAALPAGAEPDPASQILMVRLIRTPAPAIVGRIVAPEAVRCPSLSGVIDLLVEVSGTTIAEINRVRDEIAEEPGAADVETSFVLNQDKVAGGGAS